MKSFFKIALSISMVHFTCLAFSQQQEELTKFEIHPQQEIETVITDGVLKRKSDGAVLRITGIHEEVSGKNPEEIARNYLALKWRDLGFKSIPVHEVKVDEVKQLNSGSFIRFRQYYQGLRVDRNEVLLKLNRQRLVRSIQNSIVPIERSLGIKPRITEGEAISTVKKHLAIREEPSFLKTELMVHMVNLRPILCWEVGIIPNTMEHADWQCFVSAGTGEIIEVRNVSCHINGTGNVFAPNPTNTANMLYDTGGFTDGNDATNSDLDGELMNVTLEGIEYMNGMYKLKGTYAEIVDFQAPLTGLYEQSSADFSFTRDNDAFEAVMCYYHLDKSMRYVNDDLDVQVAPFQYSGGVRFDPHSGGYNASFSRHTGIVEFGDGNPGDVDAAEDAVLILHELGHGLHNWLTGDNHSKKEGLSEGLSDYWGISGTRACGNSDGYDEWEDEYHEVMQWGLMPSVAGDARVTNFKAPYCFPIPDPDIPGPGNAPNTHESGQWISTALMRIYSDLGKFKTDLLVVETMHHLNSDGMDPYNGINLQEAGEFLFQTAGDLGYSENDLCIIYKHLDDVLCIGSEFTNVDPPSGNMGNVYMKDTPCDNGEEINPDEGPMWLSDDVWVRHEKDGGLEHQNPEYKVNSPNWVYVRVRGIGCNELENAELRLYWSKASTGLVWPLMWDDYELMGVTHGDEIGSIPIDNIASGDEWITAIEWEPPNPADFNTENHHFCLLARIVSQDDPMFIAETASVNDNTRNNNNIVWKNVSVFDNDPNNIVGPISVYLGCELSMQGGHLEIHSAKNSLGRSIHEMGNVFVELTEPFKSEWVNGGMLGNNFTLTQEGHLKVNGDEFRIEGVDIEHCNQYVNIYFEPFNEKRFAAFDLVQFDSIGKTVGGERFEYRPDEVAQQRSSERSQSQVIRSGVLELYPNPTSGMINVTIKDVQVGLGYIEIFDLHGKKVVETDLGARIVPHTNIELDVSHLAPGLYLLIARDEHGNTIDDLKFVKE